MSSCELACGNDGAAGRAAVQAIRDDIEHVWSAADDAWGGSADDQDWEEQGISPEFRDAVRQAWQLVGTAVEELGKAVDVLDRALAHDQRRQPRVRVVLNAPPPNHTSAQAICDCGWRVVRYGTGGVLIRRVASAAVRHHREAGHRIATPVLDNIELDQVRQLDEQTEVAR